MNKILIIDDDEELCGLIAKYVQRENYVVHKAHTALQGLNKVKNDTYELIILDVMLPEMNGFDALTEIRKQSVAPVLMLTAKDEEMDKVKGLLLGADDYVTKPFSMYELMARIGSLVRRYTRLNQPEQQEHSHIRLKTMEIDPANRTVSVQGKNIELTAKEFDLLYFLADHKGKVYTKKQLYTEVWNDFSVFDDSNVMSFLSKLRKKIEPDPNQPFYIQTVRGVGYRFNKEA